jgi:hypothetical protein
VVRERAVDDLGSDSEGQLVACALGVHARGRSAAPIRVPAGPAPADTVTVQKIAAPVRTHTRITPQVTNIVPEVVVNKYNVDVPVAVPRAVPREIVQHKHVPKPYEVAVPRAVPVPAPYKVHPVQEVGIVMSLFNFALQLCNFITTFVLDRRDPPHPPRYC